MFDFGDLRFFANFNALETSLQDSKQTHNRDSEYGYQWRLQVLRAPDTSSDLIWEQIIIQ